MSHFVILVTGSNLESQMQPFHEFECTGVDDQYVVDIDVTEGQRRAYERRSPEDKKNASFLKHLEDAGYNTLESNEDCKYGYIKLDSNGEVESVIRRTNPNSKWDYWTIGGRWDGFLTLKNGREVNSAQIKDIDWESARKIEGIKARAEWAKWSLILERNPKPESWKSFCSRIDSGDLNEARDLYLNQPAIMAIKSSGMFRCPVERYGFDEEKYVTKQVSLVGIPYAILHDGVWYSKGEMLMFGVSKDDEDSESWPQRARELLDSLDPETLLTVIDCHV